MSSRCDVPRSRREALFYLRAIKTRRHALRCQSSAIRSAVSSSSATIHQFYHLKNNLYIIFRVNAMLIYPISHTFRAPTHTECRHPNWTSSPPCFRSLVDLSGELVPRGRLNLHIYIYIYSVYIYIRCVK